jgi:hypothetical protein
VAQGAFALTGEPVVFRLGFGFVAAPGSFVWTGEVASLLAERRIGCAFAGFLLSGAGVEWILTGVAVEAAAPPVYLTGYEVGGAKDGIGGSMGYSPEDEFF